MQPKAKKLIFITILLTGCIITSLISTNDEAKTLPVSSLPQSAQGAVTSKAAQTKTVRVQVSGAVLEPGIYDVHASRRVEEAIAAAGGMTENADSERVNLVRKVRDGMQIRVPVQKAARTSRTQRKSAQAKSGLSESASKKYGSAKAGSGRNNSMMQNVRINSASCSSCRVLVLRWRSALWKQEKAGVSPVRMICCVCRESVKLSWQSCVIMWRWISAAENTLSTIIFTVHAALYIILSFVYRATVRRAAACCLFRTAGCSAGRSGAFERAQTGWL